MQLTQLAKLKNPNSFRLISYFLYLFTNEQTFNLLRIRQYLTITNIEVFVALKELYDVDIIDILLPENNEPDIFFRFENQIWEFNILQYSQETLLQFTYTLFPEKKIRDYVVKEVYFPLELLPDYKFNIDLVPSFKDAPVNQRALNEEIRIRSKQILIFFHDELKKRHPDIVYTDSKIEAGNAQYFIKDYKHLPMSTLREGILWLLDDKFWSGVIIDFPSLRRHFVKYLVKHKDKINPNIVGIDIL